MKDIKDKTISLIKKIWEKMLGDYSIDEDFVTHQVCLYDTHRYFIREYRRIQKFQFFGVIRTQKFYRVSRFKQNTTLEFRVLDEQDRDIMNPTPEMVCRQFIAIEAMNDLIQKSMRSVSDPELNFSN
jgi:hypothetical protein